MLSRPTDWVYNINISICSRRRQTQIAQVFLTSLRQMSSPGRQCGLQGWPRLPLDTCPIRKFTPIRFRSSQFSDQLSRDDHVRSGRFTLLAGSAQIFNDKSIYFATTDDSSPHTHPSVQAELCFCFPCTFILQRIQAEAELTLSHSGDHSPQAPDQSHISQWLVMKIARAAHAS